MSQSFAVGDTVEYVGPCHDDVKGAWGVVTEAVNGVYIVAFPGHGRKVCQPYSLCLAQPAPDHSDYLRKMADMQREKVVNLTSRRADLLETRTAVQAEIEANAQAIAEAQACCPHLTVGADGACADCGGTC